MKKVLSIITTLGIVLFFGASAVNAQTRQDIIKRGLASTVSLSMDNDSYGSGFFVLPDHIATAYHVVKGASSGLVSPVHRVEKYPIVGISAIDEDNDLVILKVSGAHGIPLPIGDSGTIEIQHEVIVIGNPLGYEGTVTDGKIINLLWNRLLTDATINRGNSGGALLSSEGEVIGVAIQKLLDIKDGINLAQDLNQAVPSKYLIPLIEKARSGKGVLKPLSVEGVIGTHLTWDGESVYGISLHNQRNHTIVNARCLVIFRDDKGIICADQFRHNGFLYAGQVARTFRVVVDNSSLADIKHYNRIYRVDSPGFSHVGTRVKQLAKSHEIKILDFDMAHPHLTRGLGVPLVPLKGVTGSGLTWSGKESDVVSYLLQNHLSEDVKGVVSYAVLYDKEGVPIAESNMSQDQAIPAMGTLQVVGWAPLDVKQLMKNHEIKIFQLKENE